MTLESDRCVELSTTETNRSKYLLFGGNYAQWKTEPTKLTFSPAQVNIHFKNMLYIFFICNQYEIFQVY